jgi:Uncharacterized protein involved in cysteine biosynthesis
MADFITGFKYALNGFGMITKRGVRVYALIPLFINSLLFAVAIAYGAYLVNDFINSWLTGWWEWLRWLLWPLFLIIALTIIFFCFTIVANLIASPFNGFLAAAVEMRLTGIRPVEAEGISSLAVTMKKTIQSEFRKFAYFFLCAVPLLLLFFIPLVQFAAPFLWVLFGAWMLALEYLDFPMGNHGLLFADQKQVVKKRRQLVFGFGIGVFLLTMIPVVNFFAIPVSVCGATRMYTEQLRHTR